jgi:DNA-binding beta-propeller fold protein YncE
MILIISIPYTNFQEFRNFYNKNDILLREGIRGGKQIPPNSDNGHILFVDIDSNKITKVKDFKNPTGLVFNQDNGTYFLACKGDNTIHECDKEFNILTSFSHPLFNQLHSLDYHDGKLVVASSGTDAAIILDSSNGNIIDSWIATENGYAITPLGETRKINQGRNYNNAHYGTLNQTTHLNSSLFDLENRDSVFISLFHQGEIIKVNLKEKKFPKIMVSGLLHPHSIRRFKNGYLIVQASGGCISLYDSQWELKHTYKISDCNWIQDCIALDDQHFLFFDVYSYSIKSFNTVTNATTVQISLSPNFKPYQMEFLQ